MSTTQFKVGDRVRVTFEGEIASCFGGKYILVREAQFWGTGNAEAEGVTVVPA